MISELFITMLVAAVLPWQNPAVNEINRYPMHSTFDAHEQRLSLHGAWDFRFNGDQWRTMPVPGMWELNGCGDPLYLNIGYAWRGHAQNTPGTVPDEHNYTGLYRKSVEIPSGWKGKDIFISIGSATSCIELRIDGKQVGYSEDSKLAAVFDISRYVTPGKSALIEFEMHRWCDGSYLEDQDFWRFSGIARETYLYARPKSRIEDVRVKAEADGKYEFCCELTKGVASVRYFIDGKEVSIANPRQAIQAGIGFITEDRKVEGLLLEKSICENIEIANLDRISENNVVSFAKSNELAQAGIDDFKIRCFGTDHECVNLSGGNQQKVVLAKWIYTNPKILILDEPTRGVDIGAKKEIYNVINDMAAKGVAVIMVSSELPEVLGMADRVMVIHDGQVAGIIDGAEADQQKVMTLATGGSL